MIICVLLWLWLQFGVVYGFIGLSLGALRLRLELILDAFNFLADYCFRIINHLVPRPVALPALPFVAQIVVLNFYSWNEAIFAIFAICWI